MNSGRSPSSVRGATLIVAGGEARPVPAAEITASGFRVAGAAPLLGRVLDLADERPTAPPVAVLGYELWHSRFGGDPDVVGRSVELGGRPTTVVGVMDDGFGFPVSHQLWVPLRVSTGNLEPRSGPPIRVFGELAPGATLETARVELTALGRRAASDFPATHEQLQPRVSSYLKGFYQPSGAELGLMYSIYLFALLLVVVICGNVALLLFARAATREGELVVRSALGAGRGRIVAQMFAEALVLGGVSAMVGLLAAHSALQMWGIEFLESTMGRLPFWFDVGLSPASVLVAIGLALLGSAIAGVLPAITVTRGMGSRLRRAAAGAGGVQFGRMWGAVIVVQVAVTVAFPAIVYVQFWQVRHIQTFEAGFSAEEYLTVRIEKDAPIFVGSEAASARQAPAASIALSVDELRRRLEAETGVAGVTFVDRPPRTGHPDYEIELSDAPLVAPQALGDSSPGPPPREADVAHIDPTYFHVLGAGVIAGRAFHANDLAPGTRVAIVDQGFVDQILQGRNALGQQVRFVDDVPFESAEGSGSWYEIVGVVDELGMGTPSKRGRAAGLYLPTTPDQFDPLHMIVHVRGDPMGLVPRVREVAAEVDPTLGLTDFQRANEVLNEELWRTALWLGVVTLIAAIALLLSLAGIYAVLSYTVSRRTREVGVRVALGAGRPRVFREIFRRPLTWVGIGILSGSLLIAAGAALAPGTNFSWAEGLSDGLSLRHLATLMGYATVMLGICLLACVVPTRRALGVEPTEALRTD
jgi:putative ABC transport system permease protein